MRACDFCFRRKIKHTTEEGYQLCKSCFDQIQEVKNNIDRTPMEIEPKDPSELCVRCGICCVMLCAKVEEEEAKQLLNDAKAAGIGTYELEQFASEVKDGPFSGDLLIKMPCKFLKGRTLQYVNCAAYKIDRPKVCGSYLCKIAIRYKIGIISLQEAQFHLRSAFCLHDLSIFNWTHENEDEEGRLILFNSVTKTAQALRKKGVSQEEIDLLILSNLTPEYAVRSGAHQALFRMHLYRVDKQDFDPILFFDPEVVANWDDSVRDFAVQVIRQVMTVVRSYFIHADAAEIIKGAQEEKKEEITNEKDVIVQEECQVVKARQSPNRFESGIAGKKLEQEDVLTQEERDPPVISSLRPDQVMTAECPMCGEEGLNLIICHECKKQVCTACAHLDEDDLLCEKCYMDIFEEGVQ